MPELPEVESSRRRLVPEVVGHTLTQLQVLDGKLWHASEGLDEATVSGRRVTALERRAKLFIFSLDGNVSLLLHLKIAGQVAFVYPDGARFVGGHPYPLPGVDLPDTSTRFALHFDTGGRMYVNDQRRFCWLRLMPAGEVDAFVASHKYGPDPLDSAFTPQVLADRLKARKGRPLKAALLDQTCIAGLGNIYADESLHRAGLHPMRRAGDVTKKEVERLHSAISGVLAVALPVGGAMVMNGRTMADQESGRDFLRAHGRAGQACPTCAPTATAGNQPPQIVRAFLAGRGTYFCPTCQPAPPGFDLAAALAAGKGREREDE